MTTAHKPTYHPAIGRVHAGGYRYDAQRAQFSSRELPSHMTLKTRQDLVQKDQQQLREALLESERKHRQGLKDERARQGILEEEDDDSFSKAPASAAPELPSADDEGGEPAVDLSKYDDEDDEPVATRDDDDSGSDSGDESDEDAELARELDLIRREREEAKLKAAEAEALAAEQAAQASIHSNPLLPGAAAAASPFAAASSAEGAAGVKRRWDSDVVFKGQAKGDLVNKPKKRFINDTIRSDFHRSFLNRYVQ